MISITSKDSCCGCTACQSVCPMSCISMNRDEEGFHYPAVNLNVCIHCNLCESVCPYISESDKRMPTEVLAAKNMQESIKRNSTSGGVFYSIAHRILQDNGLVVGAAFDNNWNVRHIIIDSEEDIRKIQGSKYVQSDLEGVYKEVKNILLSGKRVLFSGTPCQVNGLNNFLHKEYENLLCIEVICHGVPTPKVWQDYLSSTSLKSKNISAINFRDKRDGWLRYGLSISSSNGKEFFERRDKNVYLRGYLTDLFLRPSCYNCPSKEGRSKADLTLGDFWGVNRLYPSIFDEYGVGLVLAYSEKGKKVLSELNIETWPSTYENAINENPMLVKSTPIPFDRDIFWRDYKTNGVKAITHSLRRRGPGVFARITGIVRRSLGLLKR